MKSQWSERDLETSIMQSKQYRAAGGVVVQRGIIPELDAGRDYVLLLDRPSRNEIRLPKGHIDEGESTQEAALRETIEESGYADLEVLSDLGEQTVEYDYKGIHYRRTEHYFLFRLRSLAQLPRSEVDARQFTIRWTPIDDAANQLTYTAEQQWIKRALLSLKTLV
jgi:8-oxo-dGTP pyrophosphatase MutT (NUDIX family)